MIALCQIRMQPHYRRDAFEKGLRKAGYGLVNSGRPAGPEDLLIIWNRYGAAESMADTWERSGGTVLVCENGYVGRDAEGRQYYAIAAHGHNGSGWWPEGAEDRWADLGIPILAWREESDAAHVLVCAQRGIGSRLMASPNGWHDHVVPRLRAALDEVPSRPIRIRPHPGNQPAKVPLEDDLREAHTCVIWSSGAGVKALINGCPVLYDAPHWVCATAAERLRECSNLDEMRLWPDNLRLPALRRMAWAQWSVAEIESGEPFARFREEAIRRAAPRVAA